MLLTLSLGEAIGARRAGGGRRPQAERAESERPPPPPRSPQPAPSSSRPRPSPAAANASLCCLMRDRQARDTCLHLSTDDGHCLQVSSLSRLRKGNAPNSDARGPALRDWSLESPVSVPQINHP